ncbi:endospore germination permease [Brevibacillus choshinensis]|uniref:GerAB/ArcD/ProY family transporter n=1 Tax=Brevibacillus choshinensis TaxID=54911 RepID=UPI002E22C730|nr:endospore germination permease [Brevibacillus choshinensis]MED4750488.1 endospore germination permease [Brevibacillus choshinensis]
MNNQLGQVTQSQIYMLFTQYLFTTMLGFRLSAVVTEAGFSSWLPLLLGAFCGYVLTYISFRLAMRRPTQFFGNYGKDIVGSWLHYPLIMIIIFSSLLSAAFVLRELQDFMVEVYLPETPDWAVTALISICIAYAVRSGVQTIFRCAQGIFFLSVLGMLVIPLFVVRDMNVQMTIAFFTHFNQDNIWTASYLVTALYGEMSFILFLLPYFSQPQKTMKSLVWSVISSLFIILSSLIPTLYLFGPHLTGDLIYPELELIRFIRAGSFLENLDPVLIAVWLTSLFIKISLFLYIAVIVLTQTFGLKDHKPFSLSMTAMMVGLSLFMAKSKMELAHLTVHGMVSLLILSEVIPIIYVVTDWARTSVAKR